MLSCFHCIACLFRTLASLLGLGEFQGLGRVGSFRRLESLEHSKKGSLLSFPLADTCALETRLVVIPHCFDCLSGQLHRTAAAMHQKISDQKSNGSHTHLPDTSKQDGLDKLSRSYDIPRSVSCGDFVHSLLDTTMVWFPRKILLTTRPVDTSAVATAGRRQRHGKKGRRGNNKKKMDWCECVFVSETVFFFYIIIIFCEMLLRRTSMMNAATFVFWSVAV